MSKFVLIKICHILLCLVFWLLIGILLPYCVLLLFFGFLAIFGLGQLGINIHVTAATIYVPVFFIIYELKKYLEFLLSNSKCTDIHAKYSANYFEDAKLFLGLYFIILIGGFILLFSFLIILVAFNAIVN